MIEARIAKIVMVGSLALFALSSHSTILPAMTLISSLFAMFSAWILYSPTAPSNIEA